MTAGDMPPWPASDSPADGDEDFADMLQREINRRFVLPGEGGQVIVDFVLTLDVLTAKGSRGLQVISKAGTPWWQSLGLLDAAQIKLQEETCDCDDDGE